MDEKFKILFAIFIYLLINSEISDGIKFKKKPNSRRMDYMGSQVIRVVPKNKAQLNYLRALKSWPNVVFWLPPTKVGKHVDIMVEPKYIHEFSRQLKRRKIHKRVLIRNVGKKVKETRNYGIRRRSLNGGFFDEHQRLDAIYKLMDEIFQKNPDLASTESIGKSFEDRDIKIIKIGCDHKSNTKPIIYIDGGTHAREWASVSTCCYIIDNLVKDYNAGDEEVKTLLTKYDFYIVPVVNPDGFEYTHTKDRMWRKNRAVYPGQECIGTDLNRNYDFHFGGEGTSSDPCDEIYGGPKPFSEPESRAISKFIMDNKSRIKAFVTLHAYGQYFLYPWGWTKVNARTNNELRRVAMASSKALYSINKTKYTVGSAAQVLYVSQGSDDWAHGVAKIPYVYCLELRDTGKYGFLLPASQIIPTGNETYVGIKAMVIAISDEKARKRTLKGGNQKSKKAKKG